MNDIDSLNRELVLLGQKAEARLKQSTLIPGRQVFVEVIDLTTARGVNTPFIIPGPVRAFRVRDASDGNAYVKFAFDSKGTDREYAKMVKGETFNHEWPLANCLFWWEAQSGKTVTIEFYRNSIITPGNFTTNVSQVFSSLEIPTAVSTVTSSAASLLAADTDRKRALIQNQGSIDILLGGATVTGRAGARPGQILMPGQQFIYDGTAAIYAITDSGSNANIAIQVMK